MAGRTAMRGLSIMASTGKKLGAGSSEGVTP